MNDHASTPAAARHLPAREHVLAESFSWAEYEAWEAGCPDDRLWPLDEDEEPTFAVGR
jgi:hypothetical protein